MTYILATLSAGNLQKLELRLANLAPDDATETMHCSVLLLHIGTNSQMVNVARSIDSYAW